MPINKIICIERRRERKTDTRKESSTRLEDPLKVPIGRKIYPQAIIALRMIPAARTYDATERTKNLISHLED